MHILIADDHAVVRRGRREILADALPRADFIEVGTGDEALGNLGKSQTSLLVLDINMPGRSGMDVLRDVKHTYPRLPVIIFSCQPEDQYAVRSLRAGAAAYINKESAPEELRSGSEEDTWWRPICKREPCGKVGCQPCPSTGKPLHEQLSDREHEVMRMIASGTSLTEIGERLRQCKNDLQLSSAHHEKMQMKSNSELTRYATANKLID